MHGTLRDGEGRTIDDPVIAIVADGPGMVIADINLHGGPWVVQATFSLLRRCGFETRLQSLEVDQLIDGQPVFDRELDLALPHAATELAIRCLLAQPHAWRKASAHVESPTSKWQDHSPNLAPSTERGAGAILADHALWFLLNPPSIAIVGEPNVGKSTLANRLFGRERTITADLPGTTRDWVEDLADIDGLLVRLIDTPGLRDTSDRIERAAIDAAIPTIQRVDLILHVIDANRPNQFDLPDLFDKIETLRVMNKADANPSDYVSRRCDEVRTSALNGAGIPALKRQILKRFDCDEIVVKQPRWWTARQRELLARVSDQNSREFVSSFIS